MISRLDSRQEVLNRPRVSGALRLRVHEHMRAWLSDRENLLFVVLLVLHLIPIWGFTYFPSQDGPAHLNNATVIRDYYRPDHAIFREYYILNKHLEPTWLGHLVLAGLMGIVPVLIAEKIFLTGYVILFPVSVRYALKALRPDSEFLAVLAFPFIYNFLFHMGFYSFSYSLALFFFVVGYWLKHREHCTLREMVTLSILTFLLYCAHPVSLVTAWLAIGFLAVWLTSLDLVDQARQRQCNRRVLWTTFRSRILVPLCAVLPALMLVVTFLARRGMAQVSAPPAESVWSRVPRLLSLESLVSYRQTELLLSILLALHMLYLLRLKLVRRQVDRWDGLLFVVAGYVYIYLTVPDTVVGGGGVSNEFLSHRMNLYPFLALILWFGAQSYEWRLKRGIQGIAAGIAVILLVLHTTKYAELNDYLEEYLSGIDLIEPNTTLLPLCFSAQGYAPDGRVLSVRVSPFLHASGYIAAQRHIVDLANYEAKTDFFPTLFRPELNPYTHIGRAESIEFEPPSVSFLTYPQRTGGRVDYVLVWRVRDEQRDHEDTQSIFQQLAAGYELIYTSPQRGFMQLYRRKDWGK